MAGRATRAGDRVRGNLGELAKALEGATELADREPAAPSEEAAKPRKPNGKRVNPRGRGRSDATGPSRVLAETEIVEVTIPIVVRERASRLMRASTTGVPGRGPGARFLIAAYVEAVSSIITDTLDTSGFTQAAEDQSLRRLLAQLVDAIGVDEAALPASVAANVRVQAEDDDTRINLDLPFQTIAATQRLMRASRTRINRRDSGGGSFLLRLYARAADAVVAGRLRTAGLRTGAERAATDAVARTIRGVLVA